VLRTLREMVEKALRRKFQWLNAPWRSYDACYPLPQCHQAGPCQAKDGVKGGKQISESSGPFQSSKASRLREKKTTRIGIIQLAVFFSGAFAKTDSFGLGRARGGKGQFQPVR
jgi:hypothetical protein